MKCEFTLCVYWQDGQCILDHIQVNHLGLCDDCILVDLTEEELALRRAAFLEREKSYS